jgi:hypothetical protein
MSMHIFATIVTSTAVAANNRGEGDVLNVKSFGVSRQVIVG